MVGNRSQGRANFFQAQNDGRILVDVHQVVRDLSGAVLADEHTGHGHLFTFEQDLIAKMEINPFT